MSGHSGFQPIGNNLPPIIPQPQVGDVRGPGQAPQSQPPAMNFEFDQLRTLAAERLPDAFLPEGDASFALALDGFALRFASVPGELALAIVRAKVVDLADVPRAGDFAKAALAANFFWGGTRGATLSVGADGALYATERRPLDELADADGLARCLDDFSGLVAGWRERSALYE